MSKVTNVFALLAIVAVGMSGCGNNSTDGGASSTGFMGGLFSSTPDRVGSDFEEKAEFKQGRDAFEKKEYDLAISKLSTFVETNRSNIWANKGYLMMGQAAEKTQKFELAIQAYSEVINSSESPFDFKNVAHLGRGNCYFEQDDFRSSLKDYETVESKFLNSYNIDPAEVITKIGLTHKMLNNTSKADKYFVRILDDFNHTDFAIDAAANHSLLGPLDPTGHAKISVVAGQYLSKEKAEAVAVKVQGQGYKNARVQQVIGGWAVLVDTYVSPREAKRVMQEIKRTGLDECVMTPEM